MKISLATFAFVAASLTTGIVFGQDGPVTPDGETSNKPLADVAKPQPKPYVPPAPEEMDNPTIKAVCAAFKEPAGAKRVFPDARLWVDRAKRQIIIDGYVAVKDGPLEMFACPHGTKEHESAVALLARSQYVHAALLAISATPGRPVQFQPKFVPPTGDRIAVWVLWRDEDGKRHRERAQQWIKRTGTDKILDVEWVFCGSQWWTDPNTGRDYYTADDGDLVCVSNFTSATLDVPIESSQANEYLDFSANSDVIPERGTPVRIVLIPLDPPVNERTKKPAAEPEKTDKPAEPAATEAPAAAEEKSGLESSAE